MPIEERWSGRHFSLDKVFRSVIIEEDIERVETDWYFDIDSWDGYCEFLSSHQRELVNRPYKKLLKYNEFNPIGVDNINEE